MKVQELDGSDLRWMVLDNEYRPIEPVQEFLRYLHSTGKADNTIRRYAFSLKQYWEYLSEKRISDWGAIRLEDLAKFVQWLRQGSNKVIQLNQALQTEKRQASTINSTLAAISTFYNFQHAIGNTTLPQFIEEKLVRGSTYKPLLHHISKGKPRRVNKLRVKEPKRLPKVLDDHQCKVLIDACNNLRDKLLISMLHETGMRVGQALGLRHSDIISWDNEIKIVPRTDNENGAAAKTNNEYIVPISKELVELYSVYLTDEYPDILDSDYVFVNIYNGIIGLPMRYSSVISLFRRLRKKTGIYVTSHMFRHTHATDLIHKGVDIYLVQKRLGHKNVTTTIDTYAHIGNKELKQAISKYHSDKRK